MVTLEEIFENDGIMEVPKDQESTSYKENRYELGDEWAPLIKLAIYEIADFFGLGDPKFQKDGDGPYAIWGKEQAKKIGIDEYKIYAKWDLHGKPELHGDFAYGTKKMKAFGERANLLRSLSQSASYQDARGDATAGCHFVGATIVTLYLMKRILSGDGNKDHIYQMYNPLIRKAAGENAMMRRAIAKDNKKPDTPYLDGMMALLTADDDKPLEYRYRKKKTIKEVDTLSKALENGVKLLK